MSESVDTSTASVAATVSLGTLQTIADSPTPTPLSEIVKNTLTDAGIGTAVGVGTGVALTTLAVAIGSDVATASVVAVSAGTAIAAGAGAGTALGSTLGPIGAAIGVVVGVFAGIVSAIPVSHYGDPAYGTELGAWGSAYIQSHPVNPILAVQVEHDPGGFSPAIATALTAFSWADFNSAMAGIFAVSSDKLRYVTLRDDTRPSIAIRAFFSDMAAKGVPKNAVFNVIDLYCDFIARIRAAEWAFVQWHPGPVDDFKNEGDGHKGDYPWLIADDHATLAFLGVNQNNYRMFTKQLTWQQAAPALLGFSTDKQAADPKSWPSISFSSPYYHDIRGALRKAYEEYLPHLSSVSPAQAAFLLNPKGPTMLEYVKEKAEEAVEVVYKDGAVTKVGKGLGIAAGIVVVLKVLAGRR